MLRLARTTAIRQLSSTTPRAFLGMFGGRKDTMKQQLVEKQDDYKVDPDAKIVFLTEENSPGFQPFEPERDLPGFKIDQWKSKFVRAQDIESTYNSASVSEILASTYTELQGKPVSENEYENVTLDDLSFRFQYCKALQQKLGFDISDYTISRAHTLADLFGDLKKKVAQRWSPERNPNAIVLRPEDFASLPNVYLNKELLEQQQERLFQKKLAEADAH